MNGVQVSSWAFNATGHMTTANTYYNGSVYTTSALSMVSQVTSLVGTTSLLTPNVHSIEVTSAASTLAQTTSLGIPQRHTVENTVSSSSNVQQMTTAFAATTLAQTASPGIPQRHTVENTAPSPSNVQQVTSTRLVSSHSISAPTTATELMSTPQQEQSLVSPTSHNVISNTMSMESPTQSQILTTSSHPVDVVQPLIPAVTSSTEGYSTQISDSGLAGLISDVQQQKVQPSEMADSGAPEAKASEMLSSGSAELFGESKPSLTGSTSGVSMTPLPAGSTENAITLVDSGSDTTPAIARSTGNAITPVNLGSNTSPAIVRSTITPIDSGSNTSPTIARSIENAITPVDSGSNISPNIARSTENTIPLVDLGSNTTPAITRSNTNAFGHTVAVNSGSGVLSQAVLTTDVPNPSIVVTGSQPGSVGSFTFAPTATALENGAVNTIGFSSIDSFSKKTAMNGVAASLPNGQSLGFGTTTVINGQTFNVVTNGKTSVMTVNDLGHATISTLLPSAVSAGVSLTTNSVGSTIAIQSGQTLRLDSATALNSGNLAVGATNQLTASSTASISIGSTGPTTTLNVPSRNSPSGFGRSTSSSKGAVFSGLTVSGMPPEPTGGAAGVGHRSLGVIVVAWFWSVSVVCFTLI